MPFYAKCCCPTTKWKHTSNCKECPSRLLELFQHFYPNKELPSRKICFVCMSRVDREEEFINHPHYVPPKFRKCKQEMDYMKEKNQKKKSLLPPGEFFILKIPENPEVENDSKAVVGQGQIHSKAAIGQGQIVTDIEREANQSANTKMISGEGTLQEDTAEVVPPKDDTDTIKEGTVEEVLERMQGSELILAEDLVICGLCGKGFLNIKKFLQHKSSHRTYSSKYRCELCHQTFCRHASLMDHYHRRHRMVVENSTCTRMVKELNEGEPADEKKKKSHFKRMSRGVQVDIKVAPPGDGSLLGESEAASACYRNLKHLEDSQLEFNFIVSVETVKKNQFDYASVYLKCLHCRFKTTSRANLRTHMRAKHPDMIDINQKISVGENRSRNHRLVSMSEYKRQLDKQQAGQRIDKQDILGQFPCPICSKVFGRLRYLRAHMPVHRKERSFKCEECGRHFKSRASVYAHKRRFHKSVMYKCSNCTFRTGVSILYQRHKRMHSVSRRGQICDVCGEAFIHSHQLKKHLSVHDATKPFQCKVQSCSWRFDNENKLKNHLLIYHAEKGATAPSGVEESYGEQDRVVERMDPICDLHMRQEVGQSIETDNNCNRDGLRANSSNPVTQLACVLQQEDSLPHLTRQGMFFSLNSGDSDSNQQQQQQQQQQAEGQFAPDRIEIGYQNPGEMDISLFSTMTSGHSGSDQAAEHSPDQAMGQEFSNMHTLTTVGGQQSGTSPPRSNNGILVAIAQQYRNAQILLEEGFTGEQVLRLLLENQTEGNLTGNLGGPLQLTRHILADPNADMVGQPRTAVPVSQINTFGSLAVAPSSSNSSLTTSFNTTPVFLQQLLEQTPGMAAPGVLEEGTDMGVFTGSSLTQAQLQQLNNTGGIGMGDGLQPVVSHHSDESFDQFLQQNQDAGDAINTSNAS